MEPYNIGIYPQPGISDVITNLASWVSLGGMVMIYIGLRDRDLQYTLGSIALTAGSFALMAFV